LEEGYEFPSSSSAIVRIGIVFGNDYRWIDILGMTETLLTLFVIPFDDRAIVPERNRAADSHADVEAVFRALNQVADVPVNGSPEAYESLVDCPGDLAIPALPTKAAKAGNPAAVYRDVCYLVQSAEDCFDVCVTIGGAVAFRYDGTVVEGNDEQSQQCFCHSKNINPAVVVPKDNADTYNCGGGGWKFVSLLQMRKKKKKIASSLSKVRFVST
jgi:hypothetical protein